MAKHVRGHQQVPTIRIQVHDLDPKLLRAFMYEDRRRGGCMTVDRVSQAMQTYISRKLLNDGDLLFGVASRMGLPKEKVRALAQTRVDEEQAVVFVRTKRLNVQRMLG